MRITCDHCGNAVFASWGNTGLVDELTKRIGWRRDNEMDPVRPTPRSAAEREEAQEVAQELRELGLETDEADVVEWLADEADRFADRSPGRGHAPSGLEAAVDWLERKEASHTPIRPEILDQLAPGTKVRDEIAWQRTAEGLLACSGHCFEQLSVCQTCNLPRTAPAHRSCSGHVPRCTTHGAEVIPFPARPRP
jgi:hypothetical protein